MFKVINDELRCLVRPPPQMAVITPPPPIILTSWIYKINYLKHILKGSTLPFCSQRSGLWLKTNDQKGQDHD